MGTRLRLETAHATRFAIFIFNEKL